MSKKNVKSKSRNLVILLAIIVIFLAGGLGFYLYGISAADPGNTDNVVVEVESGSSASMVLDELDNAGLVKNKLCGKILIRVSSLDDIQANTYVFNKDMSLTRILIAMKDGDPEYLSNSIFTIIEGATIPQAADELSKVTGISKEEILAVWSDESYLNELINKYWFITDEILNKDLKYPLEGYLYPETFFVSEVNTAEDIKQITERILDKTDKELTPYKDDFKEMQMTVHEFLSFASVVERESLFEEDRPMIAGVFLNRLQEGMPLQSDITVLYALEKSHVDVSVAETQVDSKYNTYKYPGLPVGPVCAVPATTIEDCINYEESDYFFFFATEDGDVIYTKTYDEHQRVVEENKWY